MVPTDRLDDPLEETRNQGLDFLYFADFQDFLELGEEEGLFHAVSEWPVLEEALEERDREGAVLGEE